MDLDKELYERQINVIINKQIDQSIGLCVSSMG